MGKRAKINCIILYNYQDRVTLDLCVSGIKSVTKVVATMDTRESMLQHKIVQ